MCVFFVRVCMCVCVSACVRLLFVYERVRAHENVHALVYILSFTYMNVQVYMAVCEYTRTLFNRLSVCNRVCAWVRAYVDVFMLSNMYV